jgi:hypothetical protein
MAFILKTSVWAQDQQQLKAWKYQSRLMRAMSKPAATPRGTFHETAPFLHGKGGPGGGFVDK